MSYALLSILSNESFWLEILRVSEVCRVFESVSLRHEGLTRALQCYSPDLSQTWVYGSLGMSSMLHLLSPMTVLDLQVEGEVQQHPLQGGGGHTAGRNEIEYYNC